MSYSKRERALIEALPILKRRRPLEFRIDGPAPELLDMIREATKCHKK